MLAMVRPVKTTKRRSPFAVAEINAHTWVVAYDGVMIPGAVLGTAKAATNYAFDLANAAGFHHAHPYELRRLNGANERTCASRRRIRSHASKHDERHAIRGKRKDAAPDYGI